MRSNFTDWGFFCYCFLSFVTLYRSKPIVTLLLARRWARNLLFIGGCHGVSGLHKLVAELATAGISRAEQHAALGAITEQISILCLLIGTSRTLGGAWRKDKHTRAVKIATEIEVGTELKLWLKLNMKLNWNSIWELFLKKIYSFSNLNWYLSKHDQYRSTVYSDISRSITVLPVSFVCLNWVNFTQNSSWLKLIWN